MNIIMFGRLLRLGRPAAHAELAPAGRTVLVAYCY